MEYVQIIIYVSLFSVTTILLLIALISYDLKLAKSFILSCLLTISILVLSILTEIKQIDTEVILTILLLLYPLTVFALLKNYFFADSWLSELFFKISTILFIVLSFIFIDHIYTIIIAAHVLQSLFIIVVLIPYRKMFLSLTIQFLILLYAVYLITVYFYDRLVILILPVPFITTIQFFFLLYYYKYRLTNILYQFKTANEQNRRLTHTISRMKQSNEQSRKIIIEKDLELFQMSRHASLAEITTGIAHELTQPLSGIKGMAQNMIDDINYEEFDKLEAVSELMRICSLVDKSTSIIDHIRNFSKKNIFTMKYIDINHVILDAIDLINEQIKNKNIEIIFVLDDTIPEIYGDKISLEQLVVNFILNAKDAIEAKKNNNENFQGEICVTTSSTSGFVKIIIEDNGIGISRDNIQKIWSPFFTTKKRSHSTGIGLSISNKILKEHGASVTVSSDDTGTSFTFYFKVDKNG